MPEQQAYDFKIRELAQVRVTAIQITSACYYDHYSSTLVVYSTDMLIIKECGIALEMRKACLALV